MGAKFNSLTFVILVPFTCKLKLLSSDQISTHSSSGKPFKLTILLAPDDISNLETKGCFPGTGHSTISNTPSLSLSKSNTSGTPSPSESKQVLTTLLEA